MQQETVTIAEVSRTLIKSTRALPNVNELMFDELGLFGDRQYMFVEGAPHEALRYNKGTTRAPGTFLSQREDPMLTQILATEIEETPGSVSLKAAQLGQIVIDAANEAELQHIPVSVWGWNGEAFDVGDEAAEWASEFIGRQVRLVKQSTTKLRHVKDDTSKPILGFADEYPLLITSRASVKQVNDWLSEANKPNVPTDRYRANIILDGIDAFEEDRIAQLTLTDADGNRLIFERATPCARCPIPDTDQETGELRRDVRSVLGKRGRRGVKTNNPEGKRELFFGQNFVAKTDFVAGGPMTLRTGTQLDATFGEPNWITQ